MKQIIITFLMLLTVVGAAAQRNPVEGYIITNQNDTVHGTIDYQSTSELCRICLFMAPGDSTFKALLPTDIRGFRLLSDGVYYVSRTMTIQDKQQEVFAEFLIQGGVSLLHYTSAKKDDYYLFIGEDGQEVILQDDSYDPLSLDAPTQLKQRLNQRRELFTIFGKSTETLDKLVKTPYKANELTKLVHQYDEAYCDEQNCILFEYDRKKSRNLEVKLFLEAGESVTDYINGVDYNDKRYGNSIWGPHGGLGLQFHSPRRLPALYGNVKFALTYGKMTGVTDPDYQGNQDVWSDDFYLLELSFGAEYHVLYKKKHTPFIEAGVNTIMMDFNGLYGGAGYEFSLGKHKLRIGGRYTNSFFKNNDTYRRNHFDAVLSFVF
ncbi:MAG: hypothetical protein J5545_10425 [Bacteroidaceae bacterium]|nr:hypothetical protein [Bacteroidaceae bacterium]